MCLFDAQCKTMAIRDNEQADTGPALHEPAMVPEALDILCPAPGEAALDLTIGTGGHALALALAIGSAGFLVGADADPDALEIARRRLEADAPCEFQLFAGRFSSAPRFAREAGLDAFDLILADLGVGTHQLDDPARGFSFDSDAKLDMRYDRRSGVTAWEVVNHASESELADVFYHYGEELLSRQIAASICRERAGGTIDTPAELASLIKQVAARRSRGRTWRIHPATRVMMALRIYVNGELEELDALLDLLPGLLRPGGRAAVLTYHSLEARRVKHAWQRQQKEGLLQVLKPFPAKPSEDEVSRNPRVRSAQLRAVRKL